MIRTVLVSLGIVAIGFAALVLLAWWGQERMVFQPPGGVSGAGGAPRLTYTAADGTRLHAYLVGPVDSIRSGAPVVVHFHGNAEIAVWSLDWARDVARRTGGAVVLAEYRGYDGIPGTPTYAAVRADARALWESLVATYGATGRRTTLHGFSLGSAIAAELASEIDPRALVLEAPFTSARDMARRIGPFVAGPVWGAIARVHYDTRARVASLEVPVWVAHGDDDRIIPFAMGRAVFDAARHNGEFLHVPGAGHNDLPEGERYWAWLERALR